MKIEMTKTQADRIIHSLDAHIFNLTDAIGKFEASMPTTAEQLKAQVLRVQNDRDWLIAARDRDVYTG